jgi:TolB-like protein/class 3 adenylate cyclase
VERKLAAILAADVVGYSRLMGNDEAGTLAALQDHRTTLIDPKAAQYRGRIVKLMGDGVLMEFNSVVDAVAFAIEVQTAMQQRNAEVAEDRRIVFRIGINLGDIILQDEDIHGDGVNVAARLEGLAEPGGICLSRSARDQVRDKVDIDLEDLGEIEVKNIARPVRAFRVVLDNKALALSTPIVELSPGPKRHRQPAAVFGLIVGIVGLVGIGWWQPWKPGADTEKIDVLVPLVADQPSIAVLPFDNLSGKPEQEYFADGMTEDIITDLSKMSGLFVIARNSSFAYKDTSKDLRVVGRELGVKYMLEGSVRRAGNQVRINAQLIDAVTGGHIWAERYDGKLEDVFALQDKVTQQIVAALSVELTAGEREEAARKETDNPKAYDAFLEGWAHYVRRTPEDYAEAIGHFERAVVLDPDYSRAYAALASTYWEGWERWWNKQLGFEDWIGPRREAERYLEIAMKDPTALAHQVASEVRRHEDRHADMLREARTAVQLEPNNPNSYIALILALVLDGNAKGALAAVDRATALDPYYPAFYLYLKGVVNFSLEKYDETAELIERALERNPANFPANIFLIATYAHLGRIEEAKEKLAKHPIPLSIDWMKYYWRYKNPEDMDRLLDGLRTAGAPEAATLVPVPPRD